MTEFLETVKDQLDNARLYCEEARQLAACDRWPEAAGCRDKADAIFERVERQYETWLTDTSAARAAANTRTGAPNTTRALTGTPTVIA